MNYTYEFPRPNLTVDCVVFGLDKEDLKIMLIKGSYRLSRKMGASGGFVRIDETLEDAAFRELREETGIEKLFLEQLYTFGNVKRDPRERVVTVAYYALVNLGEHKIQATKMRRRQHGFQSMIYQICF